MSECILENNEWKITVASAGAEVISAVRKTDGREYMWDAKPEIWKRHAPVLFPLVGKYKNNVSVYNGKEYGMSQHGFARDMEFEVVCADEKSVKMTVCENEESLKKYPFKFKLTIAYTLCENELTVNWKVENTNSGDMYFSIGGHPAFVGTKGDLTGAKLVFETDKDELEYSILTENGLLGDETDILKLENKKATVTENFFDRDALIFENTMCKKVTLEQDGETIVSVDFDADVFGIWSPVKKGNAFICIEPWYGRADRETFSGELQDREYSNKLCAGEVFEKQYTIRFGA